MVALGCTPSGFSVVKRCDKDWTRKPKLRDLFMVKRGSSGEASDLGYYHAGVYCNEEDEEIIHFTSKLLHIHIIF